MSENDAAIVTDLLHATDERDWPRVLERMSDHSVSRDSFGRIYVGRAGFKDWLHDTTATSSARHFEIDEVRELGGGYVLVMGTEHRDPLQGVPEVIPGAWIYAVRDGRVAACMYFRTQRDALASVTGPGRGEAATETVERWADSLNRDDYGGLVGLLDPDIRFRSALSGTGEVRSGIVEFTETLVWVRVRFDDVLIQRIEVDELGEDYAIARITLRVVDDGEAGLRRFALAVRVVDGRISEWLPFERIEAARTAVASRLAAS